MEFRLFRESDLATYLRWVNQPEIWRVDNSGPYVVRTEATFRDQWRRIVDWQRSWIVAVDGRDIGYIGFVSGDQDELTDEFFIVIGELDAWGRGYGTRAMRWLMQTAQGLGLARSHRSSPGQQRPGIGILPAPRLCDRVPR